jgi:hypothetical protein
MLCCPGGREDMFMLCMLCCPGGQEDVCGDGAARTSGPLSSECVGAEHAAGGWLSDYHEAAHACVLEVIEHDGRSYCKRQAVRVAGSVQPVPLVNLCTIISAQCPTGLAWFEARGGTVLRPSPQVPSMSMRNTILLKYRV